jgi:hypothetical protein
MTDSVDSSPGGISYSIPNCADIIVANATTDGSIKSDFFFLDNGQFCYILNHFFIPREKLG